MDTASGEKGETMSDLISRQMAIDEIKYEFEMINSALDSLILDFNTRERLRQERDEAIEIILNSIQHLPSVETHGHWIEIEDFTVRGYCSVCGWKSHLYEDDVIGMPYCPNCGAKMDKTGEE